ncbi:MAG: hypothetical protein A2283_07810 [Lentisphaerae bacterium RIFOXYA12_FULL_48_11]|nr:MAG: hypothetical protein A2283_07810 [Lentisphaerae bacterium RIFOXYA12_FULL_48_11]
METNTLTNLLTGASAAHPPPPSAGAPVVMISWDPITDWFWLLELVIAIFIIIGFARNAKTLFKGELTPEFTESSQKHLLVSKYMMVLVAIVALMQLVSAIQMFYVIFPEYFKPESQLSHLSHVMSDSMLQSSMTPVSISLLLLFIGAMLIAVQEITITYRSKKKEL